MTRYVSYTKQKLLEPYRSRAHKFSPRVFFGGVCIAQSDIFLCCFLLVCLRSVSCFFGLSIFNYIFLFLQC